MPKPNDSNYDELMGLAIAQGNLAPEHADVPVGAVLVDEAGDVVAMAHNRREVDRDSTAHAEMLVLSMASQAASDWRLVGYTLVVTLEPCAMCAMAAVWSRIERIVYGAADPKAGACWSLYNIPQDRRLNHRIDLLAGVRETECTDQLERFFAERR